MFSLTGEQDPQFHFGEAILTLDLSFDNIIKMHELFRDKAFSEAEKVLTALEMLIYEYDEHVSELDFLEQLEIYKFVLKEFLEIDLEDNKEEESTLNGDSPPPKKLMDWEKDAGLIYASFLNEYGIDLHQELGNLSWAKFMALLEHLGDKTAFKQVVQYRDMEVPSTKQADYREHVIKMKERYSLEDPEDTAVRMEGKLDAVASVFGKSKGGVKK